MSRSNNLLSSERCSHKQHLKKFEFCKHGSLHCEQAPHQLIQLSSSEVASSDQREDLHLRPGAGTTRRTKQDVSTEYMSLLKVCAQIRRKATPIFYSNNTFRITNIYSEGINLLKHGRGRVPKLLISFEVAATKLRDRKDRVELVQQLAGFLLTWDVNPKAVVVDRPKCKFSSIDSARD